MSIAAVEKCLTIAGNELGLGLGLELGLGLGER
jgi:hypothetical protein